LIPFTLKTNSTRIQLPESPPYRRWFWYLAIGSVIALASPYIANRESRYYCPDVRFFSDANGKPEPMNQKVLMDGRLYAEYETRMTWLIVGMIFVGAEGVAYGIYRIRAHRKASDGQP